MIGRIAWIAAWLAMAAITTAVQIDKQSEVNPELAPLVPGPFRAFAQTHIAAMAAEGEDAALAIEEAQRLIRRRPIPAEYLTILAIAQTKAGRPQAAGLAIQIAGQRGWREPLAQEAVLRLALASGDKAEAARRYSALFLHPGTPNSLLQELGPQVLSGSDSTGRDTLTDIVVGGKRWHSQFLGRGMQVLPPQDFAQIVTISMRDGATFDCTALGRSIKGLAQRDAAASSQLAAAAAAERCPELARLVTKPL